MRKLLLAAGVAALFIPAVASAQPDCAQQRQDNRVAGTVVGAGLGALLGSSLAGHGSRGAGAVVGAVGGGVVGNVAAGSAPTGCDRVAANGYYDANGVWHEADGYYDGDGVWVDTAPVAGDYSADVAYQGPAGDIGSRENWIERRIHEGDSSGALSRADSEHDFDTLAGIRQFEDRRRDERGGVLTGGDRADILNKLDNLTAIMRSQWGY
jgi:hypothetical protein